MGQTSSPLLSSAISSCGSRVLLGIEGGIVESSALVRKDEKVWFSDSARKSLPLKVLSYYNVLLFEP